MYATGYPDNGILFLIVYLIFLPKIYIILFYTTILMKYLLTTNCFNENIKPNSSFLKKNVLIFYLNDQCI